MQYTRMYSVFLVDWPEASCWVLPSQLQYTCTYIILFVELHIHNYHYLPIHLHHMNTYSVLARKAIHLSMSGGQTHHHPLGTISDQVPLMYLMSMTMCVYMLTSNTLWLQWLQFTQPSRQMAYTVCTCCVQLVYKKGPHYKIVQQNSAAVTASPTGLLSSCCWMMQAHQVFLTAEQQSMH